MRNLVLLFLIATPMTALLFSVYWFWPRKPAPILPSREKLLRLRNELSAKTTTLTDVTEIAELERRIADLNHQLDQHSHA